MDKLRYLPFDLQEFDSFLHQDRGRRYHDFGSRVSIMFLHLKIQDNCLQHQTNTSKTPKLKPGVSDKIVDAFTSFVVATRLKSLDGYEMCLGALTNFKDAPLRLDRCCSGQYHSRDRPIRTSCHMPDRVRQVLCHIVASVCLLVALFMPLMVKWIPRHSEQTHK